MEILDIVLDEYWSKAEAFLLPLTRLKKHETYNPSAYLFWGCHSIEDYKLILMFEYEDYDDFMEHCREVILPTFDKNGLAIESYDFPGKTVFVLDMSEWALDIEMLLAGKYSKFSREMKMIVDNYHRVGKMVVPAHIYATIYPQKKSDALQGLTPLEYFSKHWGFDLDTVLAQGELGSKYDTMSETLLINIDDICQDVQKNEKV